MVLSPAAHSFRSELPDGGLRIGCVGMVVQDDRDAKPFKVEFGGMRAFYLEPMLVRAPPPADRPPTWPRLRPGELCLCLAGVHRGEHGTVTADDGSTSPFQVPPPLVPPRWWWRSTPLPTPLSFSVRVFPSRSHQGGGPRPESPPPPPLEQHALSAVPPPPPRDPPSTRWARMPWPPHR